MVFTFLKLCVISLLLLNTFNSIECFLPRESRKRVVSSVETLSKLNPLDIPKVITDTAEQKSRIYFAPREVRKRIVPSVETLSKLNPLYISKVFTDNVEQKTRIYFAPREVRKYVVLSEAIFPKSKTSDNPIPNEIIISLNVSHQESNESFVEYPKNQNISEYITQNNLNVVLQPIVLHQESNESFVEHSTCQNSTFDITPDIANVIIHNDSNGTSVEYFQGISSIFENFKLNVSISDTHTWLNSMYDSIPSFSNTTTLVKDTIWDDILNQFDILWCNFKPMLWKLIRIIFFLSIIILTFVLYLWKVIKNFLLKITGTFISSLLIILLCSFLFLIEICYI